MKLDLNECDYRSIVYIDGEFEKFINYLEETIYSKAKKKVNSVKKCYGV